MDQILPGWMSLLWLTAAVQGLQVSVPEKKKVAMLFQPALLRCRFSTSSRQPAVVQWKFKSYCQDRTGEALGMANARAQALSKRNLEWDPLVDCVDSRRTVRVVASKQGSAVTVGDFYKGREVTIVHDADLQIGKLMWGDSGLYYCIIITPDDVEGKNEDAVELLVLGSLPLRSVLPKVRSHTRSILDIRFVDADTDAVALLPGPDSGPSRGSETSALSRGCSKFFSCSLYPSCFPCIFLSPLLILVPPASLVFKFRICFSQMTG
uniref:Immunoglobulin like domain containing receptor 2 n=1 Tax=Ornithorhynchus anatinus TaxID=9258 RepID=A0A6I8NXP0_ORNAN